MDITVYDKLYEALSKTINDFNTTSSYKVSVVQSAPNEPKYPLIVFSEPTNQPRGKYYGSRERISTLGYMVEIIAKAIKGKTKKQVCREIMQYVCDFMQNTIGIGLISKNEFDREGTQGELCRIVLVFQRPFFENKETFI